MSPVPEYQALLEGTAFVRHTDRGIVRLRGSDRTAWLQGLVTNDIARLAGGQRCYNAYLTPQGRMITDLWVVSTPDTLLLDVPASLAASLATRFDGLIFAEDVQVDDASAMMAVVDVFGPLDAAVEPELVIPDSTYGVPSSVVYLPLAGLDAFLARLVPGRREVSLDALDVLRVEAGVPRFLVDMTDDTIPLEAGIEDRAISFTKGCYVGQEIIVRVTTRGGGRVAKKLVGLRVEADARPPAAGAAIHAGDRAVGKVTSAVWSPRCAAVIALGYVHRDYAEPGTRLEVHDDARCHTVRVHPLPFVPPGA
jgi:folate-binding protein YgfZ